MMTTSPAPRTFTLSNEGFPETYDIYYKSSTDAQRGLKELLRRGRTNRSPFIHPADYFIGIVWRALCRKKKWRTDEITDERLRKLDAICARALNRLGREWSRQNEIKRKPFIKDLLKQAA